MLNREKTYNTIDELPIQKATTDGPLYTLHFFNITSEPVFLVALFIPFRLVAPFKHDPNTDKKFLYKLKTTISGALKKTLVDAKLLNIHLITDKYNKQVNGEEVYIIRLNKQYLIHKKIFEPKSRYRVVDISGRKLDRNYAAIEILPTLQIDIPEPILADEDLTLLNSLSQTAITSFNEIPLPDLIGIDTLIGDKNQIPLTPDELREMRQGIDEVLKFYDALDQNNLAQKSSTLTHEQNTLITLEESSFKSFKELPEQKIIGNGCLSVANLDLYPISTGGLMAKITFDEQTLGDLRGIRVDLVRALSKDLLENDLLKNHLKVYYHEIQGKTYIQVCLKEDYLIAKKIKVPKTKPIKIHEIGLKKKPSLPGSIFDPKQQEIGFSKPVKRILSDMYSNPSNPFKRGKRG